MTSSNGNILRVTGLWWGESTGDRWIPLTKASDAELWYFSSICSWTNVWSINREASDLKRHRAHYDVILMVLLGNFCRPVYVLIIHSTYGCMFRKIHRHIWTCDILLNIQLWNMRLASCNVKYKWVSMFISFSMLNGVFLKKTPQLNWIYELQVGIFWWDYINIYWHSSWTLEHFMIVWLHDDFLHKTNTFGKYLDVLCCIVAVLNDKTHF